MTSLAAAWPPSRPQASRYTRRRSHSALARKLDPPHGACGSQQAISPRPSALGPVSSSTVSSNPSLSERVLQEDTDRLMSCDSALMRMEVAVGARPA